MTGASANTIGGSVANRNLISANNQAGLALENGASANRIVGNYIGTDITGVNRLSNGTGIALYDAPDNTIGGTAANTGNVISGNNNDGILVSSQSNGPGSTGTVIAGNYIGIDATGSIAVGNGNNGVHLVYGAGTVVGGLSATLATSSQATRPACTWRIRPPACLIEGNYIGTDVRGFKAIGNQYDGVLLSGTLNTVGGTSSQGRQLDLGQRPQRRLRRVLCRIDWSQHDRRQPDRHRQQRHRRASPTARTASTSTRSATPSAARARRPGM